MRNEKYFAFIITFCLSIDSIIMKISPSERSLRQPRGRLRGSEPHAGKNCWTVETSIMAVMTCQVV